MIEWVE